MSELKTVRDFVRYAITQFKSAPIYYGHGTTNAEDEAWWLVLGFLKLPLTERETFLNAELTQEEQAGLTKLIKRRIEEKIPVAYLLNEAYLGGLKFYVNENVLIPRSPITELIENHFAPWLPEDEEYMNILDMCTGSGCLAILCAQYFPNATVDAVDISELALDVAQINVSAYKLEDRVNLFKSDLFEALPHKQYQVIISNPPYVDAKDLKEMPAEYGHEPVLGLEAGVDGLDIVRRILSEANKHLLPGGLLFLEVGNSADALEEAYPDLPFTWIDFEHGGDGVFVLQQQDLALIEG
jgi:ribosomal protein L3 glutamine methyltransferase